MTDATSPDTQHVHTDAADYRQRTAHLPEPVFVPRDNRTDRRGDEPRTVAAS